MKDSELIEHLHARGWVVDEIDVPMIREACAALAQPTDDRIALLKQAIYRISGGDFDATDEEVRQIAMAAQPEATVDQAIESLVGALSRSKGWMKGYADAIIRDAIDRVPARDMGAVQWCSFCGEGVTSFCRGKPIAGQECPVDFPPSAPVLAEPVEALLYEHEDGRQAVAFGHAAFTDSDPQWHRVGPVEVHGGAQEPPAVQEKTTEGARK